MRGGHRRTIFRRAPAGVRNILVAGKKHLDPDVGRTVRVALSPLKSDGNRFVESFSSAIRSDTVEVFHWSKRHLLTADLIIWHWPNQFMSQMSFSRTFKAVLLLMATHVLRIRKVWVVHNIRPHDRKPSSPLLQRMFLGSLDGIIYLSGSSQDIVRGTFAIPDKTREVVTVHGAYRGITTPHPFRPPLCDEAVRVVNFGQVRPYKGLEELLAASYDIDRGQMLLSLVGKSQNRTLAETIEAKATAVPVANTDFRSVPLEEDELESIVDRHHAVVLPYRGIVNSGAVQFALSRNKPVLVPRMGGMAELQGVVGPDWIRLYDGVIDAEKLREFLRHVRGLPPEGKPDLSSFAWERVGDDVRRLIRELVHLD